MNDTDVRKRHKDFLTATGITALLALAGLYLPVIGLFISVFVPLPVLFYRSRLGRSQGALILVCVTVIVAFAMQWRSLTPAVFFFELGLIGFVLSEMFELNLSLEKTVGLTTGLVLLVGLALVAIYEMFSAGTLWDRLTQYLSRNLELALDMYRQMDIPADQINALSQSMEGILYVMVRIMPAIVVVSVLLVVWGNLLLARPLLRSKKLFYPAFGALNEWQAPERLVWVAIFSGFLLLIPHNSLKFLGVNMLIIMMMVYFFQGIAIVSFYFEKKQFPRLLRGILYGLIVLQQFVLLLVIALGFFDLWVDFRRMKKGVSDDNESNS